MSRRRSGVGARRPWAWGLLLALLSPAGLGGSDVGDDLPSHFLVVVDASGDMKSHWDPARAWSKNHSDEEEKKRKKARAKTIARAVGDALFQAVGDGGIDLPKFDAARGDRISVALYGIPGVKRDGSNKCGEPKQKGTDITAEVVLGWPEGLARWPGAPAPADSADAEDEMADDIPADGADAESFQEKLAKVISDCGEEYAWSPIAIAEGFALLAADPRAEPDRPQRYGKVYVLNVSNLAFNHLASAEIHSLARLAKEESKKRPGFDELSAVEDGIRQVERATAAFRFEGKPEWLFHFDTAARDASGLKPGFLLGAPFHLTLSEVKQNRFALASLVHAETELDLDRHAIGPDLLALIDDRERPALLVIDDLPDMPPGRLEWELRDAAEEPLSDAAPPLPGADRRGQFDLTADPLPPACARRGDEIHCSLFGLMGIDGCLRAQDPPPAEFLFRFRVRFDYRPEATATTGSRTAAPVAAVAPVAAKPSTPSATAVAAAPAPAPTPTPAPNLYDRLSEWGDWHTIRVRPVPAYDFDPLKDGEGNPLSTFTDQAGNEQPLATRLDNETLLRLYRQQHPDASAGLAACPAALAAPADAALGGDEPPFDQARARTLEQANRDRALQQYRGRIERESARRAAIETAQRYSWLIGGIIALVLAAIAFVLWLWRVTRIPFEPQLVISDPRPARLDFNDLRPDSPLQLVAMVKVVNPDNAKRKLAWSPFHKQPSFLGGIKVGLRRPGPRKLGLSLCPASPANPDACRLLGFIPPDKADSTLRKRLGQWPRRSGTGAERLVDGKVFHLYCAPGSVEDYTDPENPDAALVEARDVPVPVRLRLVWTETRVLGRRKLRKVDSDDFSVTLELIPQRAQPPEASFEWLPKHQSLSDPSLPPYPAFEFRNDPARNRDPFLPCGVYRLTRAPGQRRFAEPFRGRYRLLPYRGDAALPAGSIVQQPYDPADQNARDEASAGKVDLHADQPEQPIQVYMLCDGQVIPNPRPFWEPYAFDLEGEITGKRPARQALTLLRDSTAADVDLMLLLSDKDGRPARREVFWDAEGNPFNRALADGSPPGPQRTVPGGLLRLDELPAKVLFNPGEPPAADKRITPLTLRIGNSARHGEGSVEAIVNVAWEPGPRIAERLQCRPGTDCVGGLLKLLPRNGRPAAGRSLSPCAYSVTIKEGEKPCELDVVVDTAAIKRLRGARFAPEDSAIVLHLTFNIRTDAAHEIRRELAVRQPLGLEQMPKADWLCIDFGTSAIAAAIGRPDKAGSGEDAVQLVDLQKAPQPHPHQNLADFDQFNIEQTTPFLPSFICCDADLRLKADAAPQPYPGFPGYKPAMQQPGTASYVSLPATMTRLEEQPQRVVFSLKSWLAQGSDAVPGLPGSSGPVPVDGLLQSAFDALVRAYLPRERVQDVGRVVVTCPNTFTEEQRGRLHEVACNVLCAEDTLDIPLRERVTLVSESDAVAFELLRRKLREGVDPPATPEHLLVYDFGAGTVDLSLFRVHWAGEPGGPWQIDQWEVLARLGVPVAGNHVDSLIARLLHEVIVERLKPQTAGSPTEYRYPIVADKGQTTAGTGDARKRLSAALNLWRFIREAKADWSVRCETDTRAPMRVSVGITGGVASDEAGAAMPLIVQEASGIALPLLTKAGPHHYQLEIPRHDIDSDYRIREFLDFITGDLVDELLLAAGIAADQVHRTALSGRGVQWPGLLQRLQQRLPSSAMEYAAAEPGGVGLKQAVARGAIARHVQRRLGSAPIERATPAWRLLFIDLEGNARLQPLPTDQDRMQVQWGHAETRVRLLQASRPDLTVADYRHPYRRFLFLPASRELLRRDAWEDADGRVADITVEFRRGAAGAMRPDCLNGLGQRIALNAEPGESDVVVTPPWPIGRTQLDPDNLV
jgi:hypothetical protein